MNKNEFMEKYKMCELSEKDGLVLDIIYATPNNFTNEILLENIMIECRFTPFPFEWWHFNDNDNYDIIHEIFE